MTRATVAEPADGADDGHHFASPRSSSLRDTTFAPPVATVVAPALQLHSGRSATARRKLATVRNRARTFVLMSAASTNHYVAKGPVRPYHRLRRATANTEFVRAATTELLAREIGEQEVPGAVAELGVFEGGFARTLSACFPNRELFLFDTFDGFDQRDVLPDVASGLPGAPYAVPPTTADVVRSQLHHPERARIRAGWFPESAAGLEEQRFCFVHVDVGLHSATASGLDWFHPRLIPGGYLLVADYNNAHTPGVKRAVRDFAARTGSSYAVLPDFQGTAVIAKPRPRRAD